ncbi:DUF4942 domain-containing protein [Stenotrophomonas maltophilia]|uniref:DUF4942 domain-containing protein n=1 Tax=Stenotrophomonas maltophilia TaxID=40324 RepID=A0AAI9C516_STEMA|nr:MULTISPECIES: DUF4942 domain-containing protein [Stenotrophomonas]EKT4439493.1 DUF4942 domain-containing protein [Stenotrophomonas maltophilia]MBB1135743.1 DUF4942 domain-containing protein [Stenotrophomonas sp. I18B00994]MBH1463610.1 DUF4942 domain-containing protein [Stenotrophomonas maltophilia]MBH1561264.1 DUF4942 domain-containing protein [Stenotrophomonas maltophilia]MBH1613794.1 DUF4942 domain-containing protein [Stenotrophomonas maltophilia]
MNEMIKSISIQKELARHQLANEKFEALMATIEAALHEADNMHVGGAMRSALAQLNFRNFDCMKDARNTHAKALTENSWSTIMRETGLKDFMCHKKRVEWGRAFYENTVPEFNYDNVVATFAQLYDTRTDMFEDGIVGVFEGLSWDYKSHLPVRFGKKIILQYMESWTYFISRDVVQDMIRAFHMFDGKPHPDFRSAASSPEVFSEYMDVTFYKNRNAHIVFKRLDLVDKLNEVIARRYEGALPPPR